MELAVIIPIIISIILFGVIFYIGSTSMGRNKMMSRMMKNQMDMMKDMTTGDMGKTLKDLSSTAIKMKKDILEENEDSLKDIANIEANIQKGAIKTKAGAVKEGFRGDDTMFCKHCGAIIDADSKFCKECGKAQ